MRTAVCARVPAASTGYMGSSDSAGPPQTSKWGALHSMHGKSRQFQGGAALVRFSSPTARWDACFARTVQSAAAQQAAL